MQLTSGPGHGHSLASPATRCFIGIGVSSYSFQPFQHAASDAASMKETFAAIGYCARNVVNVPTAQELDVSLGDFSRGIDESTKVIVLHIAGHAVVHAHNGRVWFLLGSATSYQDGAQDHGVYVDDLVKRLIWLPSVDDCLVLILADCCRSHLTVPAMNATGHVPLPPRFRRALVMIWACAQGSNAADGANVDGGSPFSKSLIRHLSSQNCWSVSQLYARVQTDVATKRRVVSRGLVSQQVCMTQVGCVQDPLDFFVQPGTKPHRRCMCMVWALPSILFFFGMVAWMLVKLCLIPVPTPCKLGPWISAGTCSKTCGGGREVYRRKVLHPATLWGFCPGEQSLERLNITRCNPQACPSPSGCCRVCDLQCNAKACKVLADILDDGSPPCWFSSMCHSPGFGICMHWSGSVFGYEVTWQFRIHPIGLVGARRVKLCYQDKSQERCVEHGPPTFPPEEGSWKSGVVACLADLAKKKLGRVVNNSADISLLVVQELRPA